MHTAIQAAYRTELASGELSASIGREGSIADSA